MNRAAWGNDYPSVHQLQCFAGWLACKLADAYLRAGDETFDAGRLKTYYQHLRAGASIELDDVEEVLLGLERTLLEDGRKPARAPGGTIQHALDMALRAMFDMAGGNEYYWPAEGLSDIWSALAIIAGGNIELPYDDDILPDLGAQGWKMLCVLIDDGCLFTEAYSRAKLLVSAEH